MLAIVQSSQVITDGLMVENDFKYHCMSGNDFYQLSLPLHAFTRMLYDGNIKKVWKIKNKKGGVLQTVGVYSRVF